LPQQNIHRLPASLKVFCACGYAEKEFALMAHSFKKRQIGYLLSILLKF